MAAADTNVLVRLLVADDPAQLRAARRFLAAHGSLYVTQIALVETSWVLAFTYGLSRRDVAEIIEQLLAGAEFVIEGPAQVTAALQAFRASRADFADCLMLESARAAGSLPLGTFDKELSKRPGGVRLA